MAGKTLVEPADAERDYTRIDEQTFFTSIWARRARQAKPPNAKFILLSMIGGQACLINMPTYRPQFTAKPTKYDYPPIVCDGRLNQASPSIYTSNHISRDGRSSLPPPLAFVYVATGGRASQIQTHVYPLHYSTAPCATNDNAIAQLRLSIALGSLHEACFGKKTETRR